MFDELRRDVAHSIRSLRRDPAFLLGVISTFALAIGANAAMFGLVTRLMLAPPPGISEPDDVARLNFEHTAPNGERFAMSTTSYPVFTSMASLGQIFVEVAAVRTDSVTIGRGALLQQAAAVQASGEYFAVLGTTPELGRFFGPADDALPYGNAVVVLSFAYWQRVYAGDRGVPGTEIIIANEPYIIIGVTPRGFNGDGLAAADVFLPLTTAMRATGFGWWNAGMNVVSIVVRLRDGTTPTLATGLATAQLQREQDSDGKSRVVLEPVVPGAAARESPQARIAIWLAGVSLIVLLIATANVGTLLLLRAAKRRRDFAVRIAIGAGHKQIARHVMVESMMLAVAGAAAGLLLSRWFTSLLHSTLLPNVAPEVGFVDARVLVVSIVVATAAGLLAGLSPFMQLRRLDVSVDLRGIGSSGSSGRLAYQNLLVGLQVALCTVLIVGAGLFARSLQRVQSQDLGFSTSNLLFISMDFQGSIDGSARDDAHAAALRSALVVPGVTRGSVVQAIPFGSFHVPPISIPGLADMPVVDGQPPFLYGATPEYLAMMNVRAVQGRLLTERDTRNSAPVVLVNETMARAIWPDESALGKCVRAGHGFAPDEGDGNPAVSLPCREVVGVVRDSRARSLRTDGSEARFMQYYVPFEQLPVPPFAGAWQVNGLLVQTTGDQVVIAGAIQRSLQNNNSVPVYVRVQAYQDLLDPQLRSWRLGASLFTAFSMLAIGIAGVGLFGVVSYLGAQRTQEIGVRLALGATGALLGRMVVGDALRLVVAGIVAGLVVALATAPLARDMLFQTEPWEPANLILAVAVLMAVTVVAALLPAWRASRVNPMVALHR